MNTTILSQVSPPNRPPKYKPIWTDRFFTGYFSNRNPLRSPLSAFYSDGWAMGKTDTLIGGTNIEISPRLTLIRRPGSLKYSSTTLPETPLSFYSFHRSDGNVQSIVDTNDVIYSITGGTVSTVFSKIAAGPNRFQGVGTQLYWGSTVSRPFWYDPVRFPGTSYQMGIDAPTTSPFVNSITKSAGIATTIRNVIFNGTSQVANTTLADNNNTLTIEFWMATIGSNEPVITLETSPTGTSTTVLLSIWVDSNGYLQFAVLDSGHFNNFNSNPASTPHVFASLTGQINDGNWHHVVCTMKYNPTLQLSSGNGQTFTPNQSLVQTSGYSTNTNGSVGFGGNPPASPTAASSPLFVTVWIDGQKTLDINPQFWAYPTATLGYWRLGEGTVIAGQTFSQSWFGGNLAYVSIYHKTIGNPTQHYQNMINNGTASYENSVTADGPTYWWKMQETTGAVMNDSAGSNTGSYTPGQLLNQTLNVVYVALGRSTAYTLNKVVIDPNGNYQKCVGAGTTGSSNPVWNKAYGSLTSDGTVAWYNLGAAGITLSSQQGTFYAYSFVGVNGHVSTVSPVTFSTGAMTGSIVTLTGYGSNDPQVKSIFIFRVADGGSTLLYVGSINNTNGSTIWTFIDALPDTGLNILIPAPVAHSNDPAPYGLTNFTFHLGRMWGSVNNVVYASAGPDAIIGNGNEAWPPVNTFHFPSQVNRLFSTSAGLVVCTLSGIYLLAGGPAITQFYPQNLIERVGIASYNAADMHGSQITLFTTDHNLFTIDASTGFTDIGFPIKDQLANVNPLNAYVTYHQWGEDHAIYLGNGVDGWYRCAPQQPPDYQIVGPVWSPKSTVLSANGCKALGSVETSPGVWNLLIGTTTINDFVYNRDSTYTTFTDNLTSYASSGIIGSIVLAAPGEMAEIGFITFDAIKVGTNPQVSVLLDEISGTPTNISGYTVQDPPLKYGVNGGPSSLFSTRCYMRQSIAGQVPPPVVCRHLQITYNFGNDTVMNELLSSTIYGRILVEG